MHEHEFRIAMVPGNFPIPRARISETFRAVAAWCFQLRPLLLLLRLRQRALPRQGELRQQVLVPQCGLGGPGFALMLVVRRWSRQRRASPGHTAT